jgi:hypothetical protein
MLNSLNTFGPEDTSSGSVISATPGQFAQNQGSAVASIGQVENAAGNAFLTRVDGSRVPASNGTKVFQGDIVETEGGASIGILFSDDTTFALGEDGRMVIDELVYDAEANTGNATFNVVQGVFSFVSGEISKVGSDAMSVKTPVVTIGIRGTSVAGRAGQEGTPNTITLLADPGGQVGEISVSNAVGTQVLNQPLQTTQVTSAFVPPSPIITLPPSAANALYGQARAAMPPPPPPREERSQNEDDEAAQDGEQAAGEGEGQQGEGEGENQGGDNADGEQAAAGEGEGEGQPLEGEGEPGEGEGEQAADGEGGEGDGQPGEGEGDEQQTAAAGAEAGDGQPAEGEPADGQPGEQVAGAEGQPGPGEPGGPAAPQAGSPEAEAQTAFDQALADGKSMDEAFNAAGQAAGAIGQQGGLGFVPAGPDGQPGSGGADLQQAFSPFGNGDPFAGGDPFSSGGNNYFGPDDNFESDEHFGPDFGPQFGPDFGPEFGPEFAGEFGPDPFFGSEFGLEGLLDPQFIDDQFFDPEFFDEQFFNDQFFDDAFFADEQTTDVFSEFLTATTGNDALRGGDGNTQFSMVQGASLGGNDTVDGGVGTDEIAFTNLVDAQAIYDGSTNTIFYGNRDGSVTGKVALTSIEQIFIDDGTEARVRLEIDGAENQFGFIVVGTSASETLSTNGDGTSAADFTFGDLNFDIDSLSSHLGSLIFAGAGDDTVNGSDFEDDIFGGSGNDTIRGFDSSDSLSGGAGDDTFIIEDQTELQNSSSRVEEEILGGSNSTSLGDTIQLGLGSSSGQTFTFASSSNGSLTTSGIETLRFQEASTTLVADNSFLSSLTNITSASGATSLTISGAFGTVNLGSLTNVTSNVTDLKVTSSSNSRAVITDADDANGRTLHGTDFSNDQLAGQGGDDILIGGLGGDTMSGGDGNDTFELNTNSDFVSGEILIGGSGTDAIRAASTSVTAIDVTSVSLSSMEAFVLEAGSASGVTLTASSSKLSGISSISADGTNDVLSLTDTANISSINITGVNTLKLADSTTVTGIAQSFSMDNYIGTSGGGNEVLSLSSGNVDASDVTFTDISSLSLSQSGTAQTLTVNGSTTYNGMSIVGTSGTGDHISGNGDLDLTGVGITFIGDLTLADGNSSRQTLTADSNATLGTSDGAVSGMIIKGFEQGASGTTDIFDWNSTVVSSDGTSVTNATDLTVSNETAQVSAAYLSGNIEVADFNFTAANISGDFKTMTVNDIINAIVVKLEDTSTGVGSGARLTNGASNTDMLMAFYEDSSASNGATNDAVLVRYQETSNDNEFDGEVSIVGIFESVVNYDNVNII